MPDSHHPQAHSSSWFQINTQGKALLSISVYIPQQALGHVRENSVAWETKTHVPASPPCDTQSFQVSWFQVSHFSTPPFPFSSVSSIYVQQCKSESNKSFAAYFYRHTT